MGGLKEANFNHMNSLRQLLIPVILGLTLSCNNQQAVKKEISIPYGQKVRISKTILLDKIKGGWAGQVIGCTYGGPTEFRFCGTMIQDYTPIEWDSTKMLWWYKNAPGLYDDIYMDLTFVQVFDSLGLKAPALAHAEKFANAGYMLWHANQAARYNILHGIYPPASGYWQNNPHSDDIDFQIEADFAGLMSPGMMQYANSICDKVGHIMNYGDGWYGGVFVADMYALSFVSSNINVIVSNALKNIPEQSDFYKCISDVIKWHREYPDSWKRTWFEIQKKWSSDIGCPDGVFAPFDIDAKLNAAYIVTGLLYGDGDYGKSLEISTRCGEDSDCNPANIGGILGALLGYSNIPDYWKQGLKSVENMDFKYTTLSLNDVYKMGYKQALEVIKANGGEVLDNDIEITVQHPQTVVYEKGFKEMYPISHDLFHGKNKILNNDNTSFTFTFKGKGFVVSGNAVADANNHLAKPYSQQLNVYIDDELIETVDLPSDFTTRRHELCWKYNLINGDHVVKFALKNPQKGYHVKVDRALIYSDKPL